MPAVNKTLTGLFHQLSRVPTTADLAAFLNVDEESMVEAVVAAGAYRSTLAWVIRHSSDR